MALNAILGGLGIISQLNSANQQHSLQKKAMSANRPIGIALNEMLKLAQGYNPDYETGVAVDAAAQKADATLKNVMRNLYSQWVAGGGTPGNSSEWGVNVQSASRSVLDPLKQFVLEQEANKFWNKMKAYAMVNQGSNAPAATYANMANNISPQFGPALNMFGAGLDSWLNKSPNSQTTVNVASQPLAHAGASNGNTSGSWAEIVNSLGGS